MRRLIVAITLVVVFGCGAVISAWADEELTPLAESGSWVAMAHRTSMTALPDVCLAVNPIQKLAFRADSDGIEFRIADAKWSLPPNVQGSIGITVGSWNATLDIAANTDSSVSALVPEDVLLAMFAAMDKATVMSVAVGKAKPRAVSLAGSSKATNAFRTCAGVHSNDATAGENPFK